MMVLPDPTSFLHAHPIVPVVVIDDASRAQGVASALLEGGIACAEVTFRTEAAADAIAAMNEVPGMHAGAGTILNADMARTAIDAGAHFLVSPGWSAAVAEVACETDTPYIPGIQTATEIMAALEYGAQVVKFFPGGQAGGLPMIRALRGPFPNLGFMPSGGVNPDNVAEWAADPAIVSVSGSWMVGRSLIAEEKFDEITRLSSEAVDRVRNAE